MADERGYAASMLIVIQRRCSAFAFVRLASSICLMAGLSAMLPTIAAAEPGLVIRSFLTDKPLCRAGRPAGLTATVVHDGAVTAEVTASLALPPGVRLVTPAATAPIRINPTDGEHSLSFVVEADAGGPAELVLELSNPGAEVVRTTLTIDFLPPLASENLDGVPLPQPVATDMLVGAIHCPLWESDRIDLWRGVRRHPERMPALGLYAQENPEVADWETKWALEHGISFFVYCWYRDGQGGAVKTRFGRGIHDGLFKSRFAEAMKFAILWENQARGHGGVADERDLLENLVPFWIETYFKRPGYLKVDGKPVLFVYDPDGFIKDLGGVEQAARAVEAMRTACQAAGCGGLTLLGEYRGFDPTTLTRMRAIGLEASFAYCWHVPGSPSPDVAATGQLDLIRATRDRGVLPQVVTVSQGWSGWHDEGTVWSIPPNRFERLLRDAKEIAAALPKDQLGSRMILLDNWNEWSEGHFLAPSRQYGFGYLDAVRNVFATAPTEHVDLIPEDVGLGSYDSAAQAALARRNELRPLMTRRLVAAAAPAGLVGWWRFDEPPDTPVAFDASGNRLGGELLGISRTPGIVGTAIDCARGVVVIPDDPRLSVREAVTIDCWVRTDTAGQDNRWIVNRVFGGGEGTGFRLGMLSGKPCFEVPQTAWSHHLTAPDPLPLGRWVHLAGTFDGRTMRLFVDGTEIATLDRPGPVNPSHFDLVIGGFASSHRAHFDGLVDEVRLFSRALSAEEVRIGIGSQPRHEPE
jgi:hypothetical protein